MSSDKVLYVNPETKDVIATGNVGIGTTQPLAKLHVNGTFYAPGLIIQSKYAFGVSGSWGFTGTTMASLQPSTTLRVSITPLYVDSIIRVTFNNTGTFGYVGYQFEIELWKNDVNLYASPTWWGKINPSYQNTVSILVPVHLIHYETSSSLTPLVYTIRLSGRGEFTSGSKYAFIAEEIAQ